MLGFGNCVLGAFLLIGFALIVGLVLRCVFVICLVTCLVCAFRMLVCCYLVLLGLCVCVLFWCADLMFVLVVLVVW